MLHLSGLTNLWRGARAIKIVCALLLCAVCLTVVAGMTARAQGAAATGQGNQAAAPRRPLPKPAGGARGFEQYGGERDASSRLVASGATRSGAPASLKAIAPMEGLAYDARPFFKWTAISGAKTYRFVLREANNPSAPIVYQTDSATPQLLYPANAPTLAPGKLYTWRVSTAGTLERKVGSPVTFFILAGEDAMEVRRALEKANLVAPKSTAEHISQAQIFEQYGIWYDALRDASEAVNANPQDTAAKAYYDSLVARLSEAEKAKQENDGQ
ncbi:MAG: DUF928 domain-containing protein [Pyrinomonadaceae bacterium]